MPEPMFHAGRVYNAAERIILNDAISSGGGTSGISGISGKPASVSSSAIQEATATTAKTSTVPRSSLKKSLRRFLSDFEPRAD
jgi:hypothetical protein